MEAKHYIKGNTVTCTLCPHNCVIEDTQRGVCNVRENIDGQLVSLNYHKIISINIDPIEKKPLYHFLPGSRTLSLAAMGCNMSCKFCQNSSISVVRRDNFPQGREIPPNIIIDYALKEGCSSISFTYSEPTVWYELMLDIAVLAKKSGIKTVMVSNGFIQEDPLKELIPYIDAANIDLKSFSEEFYRNNCSASLKPVINTIEILNSSSVWLEITTLLIEGLNSSVEEIKELTGFIKNLNPNIPWHLSRFFPNHKMLNQPAGDSQTIYRILESVKSRGINYLYAGNTGQDLFCSTKCHNCNKEVVSRSFHKSINRMKDQRCPDCLTEIPGLWY